MIRITTLCSLRDYDVALKLVMASSDADAALFCSGALRDPPAGLRAYGVGEYDNLYGIVVLLPRLPPFAFPVVLPAGSTTRELLAFVAAREPSPRMALGPARASSTLADCWPPGWLPCVGRRPETLLRQSVACPTPVRADLPTRLADEADVSLLSQFRIRMEHDSGTTIVSTMAEATAITRDLVGRKALRVVEVAGHVAGCAAITTSDDRYEQVGFVYVEPQHRLQGVSDRLLADLCEGVHRRGHLPIAFTEAHGPLANRLLTLGFEPVGNHLKLYFGEAPCHGKDSSDTSVS